MNLGVATDSHAQYEGVPSTDMILDYQELAAYFLDSDLSILGEDLPIYKSYAARIRQEYRHVPDPSYLVGRPKVLVKLTEGEHIFQTDYFRNICES